MDDIIYIEIRKRIGANFKKLRKQRKLSLRQVEALTGVDHSWIGKFEKGLVNFEIDTITTLIGNFEANFKEVFNFDYTFPPDK